MEKACSRTCAQIEQRNIAAATVIGPPVQRRSSGTLVLRKVHIAPAAPVGKSFVKDATASRATTPPIAPNSEDQTVRCCTLHSGSSDIVSTALNGHFQRRKSKASDLKQEPATIRWPTTIGTSINSDLPRLPASCSRWFGNQPFDETALKKARQNQQS